VCNSIVFAEYLPSFKHLIEKYKKLNEVEDLIKAQTVKNGAKHPILSLINKKIYDNEGILLNLEFTKEAIELYIDKFIQLGMNLNLERKSKCLECGSDNIKFLNLNLSTLNYPPLDSDIPVKIGMKHPNCGGDLQALYSNVQYFRNINEEKFYSQDGLQLF
jgi:hypothetical protein